MCISKKQRHNGTKISIPLSVALILFAALSLPGQVEKREAGGTPPVLRTNGADSVLGPGDIVYVGISDSPELSGDFQVTRKGEIAFPLIGPLKAQGLTPIQLSKAIADALKAAELLLDPIVTVSIDEYHSRTVTVLGAVVDPSVYPLQGPTTVMEVIARAGGLRPTAGNTLTIVRTGQAAAMEEPSTTVGPTPPGNSTLNIDLSSLVSGKDPSLNVEVRAGDIVSVSTAPVVYVVGAVSKPGGFVLQDPGSGVTVLQALAMAEGLKSIASSSRSLIIRRSASGQSREQIPVDVAKLMNGKGRDLLLEPNDILFVPESGMKKSLQKMAEIASSGANGVAIYGLGYRIAGIHQ